MGGSQWTGRRRGTTPTIVLGSGSRWQTYIVRGFYRLSIIRVLYHLPCLVFESTHLSTRVLGEHDS